MKKIERARELRKEMTEAEKKAWEFLRDRRLGGLKFRRQHVIAGYIVDFYCAERKLVLEIDGEVHQQAEQKAYDEHRSQVLSEQGLQIVRIANGDVGESFFCKLREKLNL